MSKYFLPNAASWDPYKSSGSIPQLKGARCFSFEELKKCTNNFSEVNDIGSGGYGKVNFYPLLTALEGFMFGLICSTGFQLLCSGPDFYPVEQGQQVEKVVHVQNLQHGPQYADIVDMYKNLHMTVMFIIVWPLYCNACSTSSGDNRMLISLISNDSMYPHSKVSYNCYCCIYMHMYMNFTIEEMIYRCCLLGFQTHWHSGQRLVYSHVYVCVCMRSPFTALPISRLSCRCDVQHIIKYISIQKYPLVMISLRII